METTRSFVSVSLPNGTKLLTTTNCFAMSSISSRSTASLPDFIRLLARPTRSPGATETRATRRRTGARKDETALVLVAVRQVLAPVPIPTRTKVKAVPSQLHARVDREASASTAVVHAIPRSSARPRARHVTDATNPDTCRRCAKHRHRPSTQPSRSPNPSQPLLQWRPMQRNCSPSQALLQRLVETCLQLTVQLQLLRPSLLVFNQPSQL